MLQYKVGIPAQIPVRLLKSDGTPLCTAKATGVSAGNMRCTIRKSDGTVPQDPLPTSSGTATATAPGWVEITSSTTGSPLQGSGLYLLTIPAMYLDKPGPTIIAVQSDSTAAPLAVFYTMIDLVTGTNSDIFGMLYGNAVQDQQVYTNGKLISARIRIYDNATNATVAGATGLLYTYTVNAAYDESSNLIMFRITG